MKKEVTTHKKEVIKALKKLLAPVLKVRGIKNKPLCRLEYNYRDNHITLEYLSLRTYMPNKEPEKYIYKLLVHYDLSIQSNIEKILNRTVLIMIDQLVSKEQDLNCCKRN